MNLHTAAFAGFGDRPTNGPNLSNPWEIACIDTWDRKFFTLRTDGALIGDPAAAMSLHDGMVTSFLNGEHWTLFEGKPVCLTFDREKYLSCGGVSEQEPDPLIEQALKLLTRMELNEGDTK